MANQTQHFTITISYQGNNPDTFTDAEIGDLVYRGIEDTNDIEQLEHVLTGEEPQARPSAEQLETISKEVVPDKVLNIQGVELAVISAAAETMHYALGNSTKEEYLEGIKRSHSIGTNAQRDAAQ